MRAILLLGSLCCFLTAYTQTCEVVVTGPNQVCPGVPITYTGTATVTQANQAFDFNNQTIPPGWQSSGGANYGVFCGNSLDNSPYFWASTATGTPQIVTDNFDVCTGGTLEFEMKYAIQAGAVPCEGPDEQDEGVTIQYSTDNGATWIDIIYYSPGGFTLPSNPGGNNSIAAGNTPYTTWNTYAVPIPPAAQTTSTKFRWVQTQSSGGCCDNWGLDNVFVNAGPCLTTNIGWDVNGSNTASGNTVTLPIYSDTVIVAGVYDDNGNLLCQSAPFSVTVFTPHIDGGPDQTICAGQSVTLAASGGTNFTWDNGVTNGVAFTPAATTTYTVNGIDNNGCAASDQVLVTVNPLINYTLSYPDPAYCIDAADPSPTLSTPLAGTYSVSPNTVSVNATTGVVDLSSSSTTSSETYTVTFTPTNACYSAATAQLTVNALPSVDAGTNTAICIGNNTTLTASGASTYSWNNGLGAGTSHTVSPTVTTTYTVTGTDVNGCVNTDQVQVTVNPLPNVTAGADAVICFGDNTTLTASGASTYSWDNGLGAGASHTVNPTVTTTYTVTGTDANNCVNTDQVQVTVNPLPMVNAGLDAGICIGDNTTLTASGASTYSWDNGLGAGASHTVNPNVTTTYTVTGTDNNNCQNTDEVTVTVYSLPVVNAGNDTTICSGNFVTMLATGNAVSYVWNNNVPSNGANITPPVGTTTYTVTATSAEGCINTDSRDINVNPLPTATIAGDITVCLNDPQPVVTFNASNGTGPYIFRYTYNNGATLQVTSNASGTATINVPTNVSGSHIYNLISVQDASSTACLNPQTGSVTVVVNELPTATIAGNITICQHSNQPQVTLTGGNTVAPYTFTYTLNGVQHTVTTPSGSNVAAVDAPTNVVGVFVYELVSVQDASVTQCSAAQGGTATVTINPLPMATISGNAQICRNDSQPTVIFQGSNGVSPFTFTYIINGGAPQTITSATGQATISVPTAIPGTYQYELVSVQESSVSACLNTVSDTAVITVWELPVVSAGNDFSICEGQSTALFGRGAMTYQLNNGVYNGIPFVPQDTLDYIVEGVDIHGCKDKDTVRIFTIPIPQVDFVASEGSACSPLITSLTNLSTGILDSCQWKIGDTTYLGCGQLNLILEEPGCYDVTLTVSTPEGCTNSKTAPLFLCVLKNPVASFELTPGEVKSSNTMVNFFNHSSDAVNYHWDFEDGATSNQENPVHYFPDTHPGNYAVVLTAISEDGCIDTTHRIVRVLEDLIYYVPNAFTPDGDEYNNVFKPVLTSGFDITSYQLQIFNRWGELIFESLDHDYGWDGTYLGKVQMDGTYIWKINVKKLYSDDRMELKGHVTIVK